jgi:hypothetical protein
LLLRRAPLRKRFAFVAGNDVEIVSFRFQTAKRIRTPAARTPGLCRIAREGAGPLIESGAITRGRKAVAYSGE